MSQEYKSRQSRVIENAKRLAQNLVKNGYNVLTGGTDNHLMLVNAASISNGLTGAAAQQQLEHCGIVVDRMLLPYDDKPGVTSGLRIGTPIVTKNGFGLAEIDTVSQLIDTILQNGNNKSVADSVRDQAKSLARKFPLF